MLRSSSAPLRVFRQFKATLPSVLSLKLWAVVALILAWGIPLHAADGAGRKRAGLLQEDLPFQGACISANFPEKNTAMKGFAIRVAKDANVLWDSDLLRMAAGWTGGYISTRGVAFDGGHGQHPKTEGEQKFGTAVGPGWADARGSFVDPRTEPFGPLLDTWCRWDGLYVHGMDVVLSYTVHGTKIHEQPGSLAADGQVAFVRTFSIEKAKQNLTALLADVAGATVYQEGNTVTLTSGSNVTTIAILGKADAKLAVQDKGRAVLQVAKGAKAQKFSVVIWSGAAGDSGKFAGFLKAEPKMVDYAQGGPAHWPQAFVTNGVLNTSTTPDGAYVTDSITAPEQNPWNRRVRFGGMDFFSDGTRAALCTHDGDIWIVSGIHDKLDRLEWRRFASGQYETLGLVIVDDVIYTSGRDQITRYRDLNNDGAADFYENFNNQFMSTEGFHEFVFDLQTDKAGNFYFVSGRKLLFSEMASSVEG